MTKKATKILIELLTEIISDNNIYSSRKADLLVAFVKEASKRVKGHLKLKTNPSKRDVMERTKEFRY